jgi:imidazolonepropionase-like amidohydrolase
MRLAFIFMAAVACASKPPAPASVAKQEIRRSIVHEGQRVGGSVLTWNADGTITNVVDIHDNGRGPHADATLRLAPDGTLASLDARGHTEMDAPVDEHFAIEGRRARWKSLEEQGEKDLAGPAFFIPNSVADADAFLVSALLQHGRTLAVLPGGMARLQRVGEATVQVGGRDTHLVLEAVTGISFQPSYVWTRDDGRFFAEVAPGFWFGEEGGEGAAAALVARQEEIRKARDRQIAERIAHKPPPAGFAILHARVLDLEKRAWVPDQTVLVSGGRIAAVGTGLRAPAGAEVIDLGGKALLPGLWDMHAHLGPSDGVLDVASGVTTVRDVGNVPDLLDDFKKQFDEGTAVGPHVYRAGIIEGRGPDAGSGTVLATTEPEARAAVEFYARRGYEMIKIYNSIPPAIVPVLVREAHARGMGVTGHIPYGMLASEAIRAGYDGVEHINQLLLTFFADHKTDTRTLLRFSLVGEQAADFDFRSARAKELYALMREHRTVVDPTYTVFEQTYVAEQGKVLPGWAATVPRLPIQIQRSFVIGGLPLAGKKEVYARSWERMLSVARILRDEQVTVVAGTDSFGGLSLHRELELLVEAGYTPAEALRAATVVPAQVMKSLERTGTIAPGKVADLVVVDGDPLARISDLRRTEMTFRSGVLYPAKDLYETVGVAPW